MIYELNKAGIEAAEYIPGCLRSGNEFPHPRDHTATTTAALEDDRHKSIQQHKHPALQHSNNYHDSYWSSVRSTLHWVGADTTSRDSREAKARKNSYPRISRCNSAGTDTS